MQFAMALLTMKSGSCLFVCEGHLIKSGANMHFKTLEDFESNAMRLLSDDASRVSCVALDFGATALIIAIPSRLIFLAFAHLSCSVLFDFKTSFVTLLFTDPISS